VIAWDDSCIRLPDSKTGAKTVYLSPAAIDLIKQIKPLKENSFVLPGKLDGKPLAPPQKAWRRIRKRAGLDDVRFHDLRHTFASVAASQGLSLQMIGELLGQKNSKTTARYSHLVAESKHLAVAAITASILDNVE